MSGGLVSNAPLTASGRLILRKFAPMLEHFPSTRGWPPDVHCVIGENRCCLGLP